MPVFCDELTNAPRRDRTGAVVNVYAVGAREPVDLFRQFGLDPHFVEQPEQFGAVAFTAALGLVKSMAMTPSAITEKGVPD